MDSAWYFVWIFMFLVVVALIVLFCIYCAPPKNQKKHKPAKFVPNYLTYLRTQVGTDVLSPVFLSPTITDIPFNLPTCDNDIIKITHGGIYSVSYSLQVGTTNPVGIAVSVRRRTCDSMTGFEALVGSQEYIATAAAENVLISHTFAAQLDAGDVLRLSVVATRAETAQVPASTVTSLQTPTTLASLWLVQIA